MKEDEKVTGSVTTSVSLSFGPLISLTSKTYVSFRLLQPFTSPVYVLTGVEKRPENDVEHELVGVSSLISHRNCSKSRPHKEDGVPGSYHGSWSSIPSFRTYPNPLTLYGTFTFSTNNSRSVFALETTPTVNIWKEVV